MDLPIRIETRTGDTPANRRARQRQSPPHLLLTTPESLAVLLSLPDAPGMFAGLSSVVLDEVHALAGTKRGDQLALCVARLGTLAPGLRRVGLSATVAHPAAIQAYVGASRLISVADGAPPELSMMLPAGRLSWSGHMGLEAAPQVMDRIRAAGMTIVFVNTRAQAELLFQALWKLNETTLPIALHHGSLEVEQRRKVEAAMAAGKLRAVVATSSLDLGIDWGGVDQVIQVGAPKGISRLLQRVGRANHRMDEPSRAVLVPANRFEVLECEAAMLGVAARELDGDPPRPGGLDVLAQHLLGLACSAPFLPDDVFAEVRGAAPYADLPRDTFDGVLRFVEDGGYALAAYERWKKLFRDSEGRVHVRSARIAVQHRMNIGTIVEAPLLKVRLVSGKRRFGPVLGEIEEYFVNLLRPGDTFMFAGRLLRFIRLHEMAVECAEGGAGEPMVPAYEGGRLPLTTNLADRVRALLHTPSHWNLFPEQVQEWLQLQRKASRLPGRSDLLVESFPRGDRWYLVAYCFEGRNAHQTLGMLLTRRMERAGMAPLGFVATDYVLGIWSAHQPVNVARLFDQDMLGDDLEDWLAESSMLKRTFRNVAVIAGLIERHHPGAEKTPQAGHGEQRPDLRRAAQAPARPHPAARRAGGCRRRADRCRPRGGDAGAGEGTHRAHGAVTRLAAGGAGAAGDRPRKRAHRGRRGEAAGGSGGDHRRGDGGGGTAAPRRGGSFGGEEHPPAQCATAAAETGELIRCVTDPGRRPRLVIAEQDGPNGERGGRDAVSRRGGRRPATAWNHATARPQGGVRHHPVAFRRAAPISPA